MTILSLIKKYKSFIAYVFFGLCTTAINLISYKILYDGIALSNVISTIIAWFIAVSFAFITNKIWVFDSKNFSVKIILPEIIKFFLCRLFTGVLDVFIMWISVDKLNGNPIIWKLISNIIVIVLNYIASKLIIFYKGKNITNNEK